MRSNYKKLGPYIREIDVRNTDLRTTYLRGISSIYKELVESKANTVGVSFHNYKIVEPRQFAFNPNTARMGDKIPIALNSGEQCIVSSIYPVFEVIDPDVLLPEYLMMWFRRPEFDRYARFMSHGSAREIFGWDEMCGVALPVPAIEKQREIVKEYQTVVDRIQLNEQLNQKLEETAQAIYRHWFVDFELPMSAEYAQAIGKPKLEGQPYKSSGGEMEFNDVLDQEIPKGWENGTIEDLGKVVGGSTPSTEIPAYWARSGIPWLSPKDLSKNGYKFIGSGEKSITKEGYESCSTVMLPKRSVLFSSRAPIGLLAISTEEVCTNQGFKSVVPKAQFGSTYVYYYLKNDTPNICNQGSGSTFDEISGSMMKKHTCVIPNSNVCISFSTILDALFKKQQKIEHEQRLNEVLLNLLLSKVATV